MLLRIIKIFTGIILFVNIAMAAEIHHFDVEVNPTTAAIGEAIDLTIRAVDKNDEVIKDYEGSILIFSESDKLAQFPSAIEDNSYTFSKSNEGVVKFENAVIFSKEGKNDIHVYDLGDQTDSVLGLAEVEITGKKVKQNIKITILSPQGGLTIGEKKIVVSGKSKKNHQIKIVLNNKSNTLTTTNKDGIFEKEIDGLENGENIIKAYVLDADGKEIGTSKEIIITSNSVLPKLNKVKITPDGEIETNSKILAEVYASKGLEKVSIILNDSINILKEDGEGIYKGKFLAPKKEGTYKLTVLLEDELGHKINNRNEIEINVIPELNSPDVKKELKNNSNIKVKKDICKKGDFSGDVFDGKCGKKPKDYIKPIDLGIKNLKIVQLKTKSVLTWDNLEDAIKYEIYKKVEGNKLELIDTVKKAKYVINMRGQKIKYEYFAVRAIGKEEISTNGKKVNKEFNGDLSEVVKIKTGTKEIFLILIALLFGTIILLFPRKRA